MTAPRTPGDARDEVDAGPEDPGPSPHGHGGSGGHAGHGDHVARFRRLFWIMLVLAVPTVGLSPM
ncbi:hypothetical protein, partial [Actinomycetospora chlora]|uniref:hypothetical protein n=1 Tax=Actinomycetospora chlora TaxID=663608 RepID=UPI0031EE2238